MVHATRDKEQEQMEMDETAKSICQVPDGNLQEKYPGKKVVIPVIFAVCLALFLASLVSILSILDRFLSKLDLSSRTEPLSALLFRQSRMISNLLKTLRGTNLRIS